MAALGPWGADAGHRGAEAAGDRFRHHVLLAGHLPAGCGPDVESIVLSWPGGVKTRTSVSYADLYVDFNRQKRKRNPREFADKVVVIGVTASGLHDIRPTPVDIRADGVDILTTAIDNLKNANYLREVPAYWSAAAALLLLGLLFAAFTLRLNTIRIGAGLAGVTLVLLAGEDA